MTDRRGTGFATGEDNSHSSQGAGTSEKRRVLLLVERHLDAFAGFTGASFEQRHMATLLDGETLTTATLHELGEKQRGSVALDPTAKARVEASREIVDRIVSTDEVVYGINTGFGLFSNVTVSADKLCALQDNLIRSHSAGCGEPLTRERSRRLLALRINVLAKGHSVCIAPPTIRTARAHWHHASAQAAVHRAHRP